jgi:hypothetical protein
MYSTDAKATAFPPLSLARVLCGAVEGSAEDLPGMTFNLWNADRLEGGEVLRWVESGLCVAFAAYARLSMEHALMCRDQDRRVIPPFWYDPAGPVALITEAWAGGLPGPLGVRLTRLVSELPGVTHVAAFRHDRFRIHRARPRKGMH